MIVHFVNNEVLQPRKNKYFYNYHDTQKNPMVVHEEENAFHIVAEIPGVKKEDVKISFQDNTLLIQGERKYHTKEQRQWLRREISYGKFERTISFNSAVDSEKIFAEYKDGILHIMVPKQQPKNISPKEITIQ